MVLKDQVFEIINQISPSQTFKNIIYENNVQKIISSNREIFLLAVGKAAYQQLHVVATILKSHSSDLKLREMLVLTKYNHSNGAIKECQVLESGHPVCDENSLNAGIKAKEFVSKLPKESILIVILSGGASSLMIDPIPPFTLQDKIVLNNSLIKQGASIDEINLLRKEISNIKNGGLLNFCKCDTVLTLITSDIPTDDLSLVGSGPTIYSPTASNNIRKLVTKYLDSNLKDKYLKFLNTKKIDRKPKLKSTNICVANGKTLLSAAENIFYKNNFSKIEIISELFNDKIEIGIKEHLDIIDKIMKENFTSWIVLSGGELNVHVKGNGKGGRNTEFVIRMTDLLFNKNILAFSKSELNKIQIFAVGTDGSDGPTDAAGAWMDFNLFNKNKSIQIENYLTNYDSYNYFEKLGSLIKTGPSGTNLMDIRGILLK